MLDIVHDEEFRRVLSSRAEMIRQELAELAEQQKQLESRVAAVQQVRRTLNPLLIAIGLSPISEGEAGATVDVRPPLAIPGNRGENMPPRREIYRDVSIPKAVATILNTRGEMHADDIVRMIYEIQNQAEVRRVKRSIVSTLSHGVGKKLWERSGKPNTFRRLSR